MTKEKSNPQSPEEMAKTAQEAAVKSAMEQAQAMFGNIPGFQMPGGMQEQIMTQMGSGVPDMRGWAQNLPELTPAVGRYAEYGICPANDAGSNGRYSW